MSYTVRNDYLDIDEKSDTMLGIIKGCRIFDIIKHDEKFEVFERCDEYYSVTLTREQLLALAEEIRVLAESV